MSYRQYFGFRIAKNRIPFLAKELKAGRLRQGWGWDKRQDLRNLEMDEGAKRNLPIRERVKKGDILLIPHLPTYGLVTIARASKDFYEAYRFELSKDGNLGHIFPVEIMSEFNPHHERVSADIRKTLKARNRFWSVNAYARDIEELIAYESSLLEAKDKIQQFISINNQTFQNHFARTKFSDDLFTRLDNKYTAAEWEQILVYGLQRLYPQYVVEHLGGRAEKDHGTDILIRMPHPLVDSEMAIAIQVKDYKGNVDNLEDLVKQIGKADEGFKDQYAYLEKWLLLVGIEKENSTIFSQLEENHKGIKVLYKEDVQNLLTDVAEAMLSWQKV